jgi:hypothetical protein
MLYLRMIGSLKYESFSYSINFPYIFIKINTKEIKLYSNKGSIKCLELESKPGNDLMKMPKHNTARHLMVIK